MPLSKIRTTEENLQSLEGVLRLACIALSAPYSLVALAEEGQGWTQSTFGVVRNQPSNSFFKDAISSESLFEDQNAIGVALKNNTHKSLGVFCIVDEQERKFSRAERDLIIVLKKQIEILLENRRLEQFIQDQNEVIIQHARLATLGQMTAEIIHEINNPLTITQAHLGLMHNRAKASATPDVKTLGCLEKVMQATDRINTIIKGVKSFSKNIDHDPFEAILVSEMIEYSLSFCLDRLKLSSVKLIKESIPKNLKISCRSVQISQVMINLINNAIDATHGMMDRWVEISVQDHGEKAEIKITDCGRGIEPKVLEKLFTPFFTTKEKDQGTGLGLSISKNIVESHYGSLRYDESTGHTSFVIALPKAV